MALIQCTINSRALGMNTDINVVLPEAAFTTDDHPSFPVMYLLHGGSDNFTNWQRYTMIERYATDHNLVVVMPSAALSFYNDMVYGQSYYSYMAIELPQFVKSTFPVSHKREDTFICGLSMGGYGSLRIGLSKPENYAAVGSFSGANDLSQWKSLQENMAKMFVTMSGQNTTDDETGFDMSSIASGGMFNNVFGDKPLLDNEKDPVWLAKQIVELNKPVPRLYVSCGTQDFVYEMNQVFCNKLSNMGFPFEYEEWDDGHTWNFWDESVKRFIGKQLDPVDMMSLMMGGK